MINCQKLFPGDKKQKMRQFVSKLIIAEKWYVVF